MLIAGHAFADVGVAEEAQFEQGEDRARQVVTWAPQLVQVSTRLTQAQYDRFVEWFEEDLSAGTLRFDAPVAAQGGVTGEIDAVAWWEAQFVGPPRAEAQGPRWLVTAELVLLDGPYSSRTAPGLLASLTARGQARAELVVATALRAWLTAEGQVTAALTAASLRGLMTAQAEVTGYAGDPPAVAGDPDTSRLWQSLAGLPVPGDEIDRAAQINLQRAWTGVNDGLY
jgi:hypothetical protein